MNEHDPYSVSVLKYEMTIGHVPREVSRLFETCMVGQ